MMGFGGGWMMLWMVIFWVVVVSLALWLLSRLFPGARDGSDHAGCERPPAGNASLDGTGRALDILKERYARGEITRAEYLEMRRDLEG